MQSFGKSNIERKEFPIYSYIKTITIMGAVHGRDVLIKVFSMLEPCKEKSFPSYNYPKKDITDIAERPPASLPNPGFKLV